MLANSPPDQSKAETLAWIATLDHARDTNTGHSFALECRGTAELIGVFSAYREQVCNPFAIGYWLRPEHWGRGYCQEAGKAVIRWLEEAGDGEAVLSGYFHDNPASGAVLRRLGFLPSGRNRLFSRGRGSDVDHILMVRIRQTG
jgi:RimJ/RimL family protein N-acetyltransferase